MARKAARRASKQSSRTGSTRSRKSTGGKKTSKKKPATRETSARKTSAKKRAAKKKTSSGKKAAAKRKAPAKKQAPAEKRASAKKKAAKKKAAAGRKKAPSKKPARKPAARGAVRPRSSSQAPRWPTGPRPIPERELMTDDAEELNLALAEFEEGVRNVDDADIEYAAKKGPKKIAGLARDVPQPLKELWADLKAMVTCVRDYWSGTYREIPWKSIAAMTGAIVYFVSPIDVIPDFVPLIGYVDDAAVISLALKWVADDLAAYRRWKEGVEASGTAATE
jgi:uncharacterized membrane protein YkvA (DUF1232 family)